MIIDSDYKCTVCGTKRGNADPVTGKPWRSKKGWCQACCRRGGKLIPVLPCVDCGTPGGPVRTEHKKDPDTSDRPIRYHGRCKKCYDAMQRRMKKDGTKPGSGIVRKIASAKEVRSKIGETKAKLAEKIKESQKPKPEAAREYRIELMRCIQEYRAAEKKWKVIKAYKLDAAKETESVLLSA